MNTVRTSRCVLNIRDLTMPLPITLYGMFHTWFVPSVIVAAHYTGNEFFVEGIHYTFKWNKPVTRTRPRKFVAKTIQQIYAYAYADAA